MNTFVLDEIAFQPDLPRLLKRLHVKEGRAYAGELERLAAEAQAVARPRALYKLALIESRDDREVVIDGTTLTSRVLRVNLALAHRVFPYVVTCGVELEDWSRSVDDALYRFWADTIKELALFSAVEALTEHLAARYRLGRTSTMSPGALEDWPIQEQRALFAILGDTRGTIGVELSESLLMIPTKSVSGIRFPTEESFESCQLCPRENCPGRRAPYDETLYERKYRMNHAARNTDPFHTLGLTS